MLELICHRYERRSVQITANPPFTAWDVIVPSSSMTIAAGDRLVPHCHILAISGENQHRAQASRRNGSQQPESP